jgi:hypothetical protein
MTARTHDLAAITAFGLIVITQPVRPVTVATVLVAILANQIGGIAPDIDQPTAPFWRNSADWKIFWQRNRPAAGRPPIYYPFCLGIDIIWYWTLTG